MINRILLPITILALILTAGCSKNDNQVQVISAVYGESTNFADVSNRIKELLRTNSVFQAHPSYLQADPMSGYNKVLVIIYDVNGRQHIFTAAEGDSVSASTLIEASKQ